MKKLLLLTFIGIAATLVLTLHQAKADHDPNYSDSRNIYCDKKGTSGTCTLTLSAAGRQAFKGTFEAHLEGHGTYGPSGGKGGVSACLSPSTSMWRGSCWNLVSSSNEGNVGDNDASFGEFTKTGGDLSANFAYWVVDLYANDATWDSGNMSVEGRTVEVHFDNSPSTVTVGETFGFNWTTEHALGTDFEFPGFLNCSQDGTCTVTGTGSGTVTINARGASGSGPTWRSDSSSISASVAPTPTPTPSPTPTPTPTPVGPPPPGSYNLTIAKAGTGSGTVTGTGVNCGSDCTHTATSGTNINLSATAGSGSTFVGFSGTGCTTSSSSCNFSLTSNRTITATFNGSAPPPPSCLDNADAIFTSPIPAILSPGEVISFVVRVTDSGDTRWYHGDVYKFIQQSSLTIINRSSPSQNGLTYGHTEGVRDPGGYHDWTFDLTAPLVPGPYILQMQMRHDPDGGIGVYKVPTGPYPLPSIDCAPAPSSETFFGDILNGSFTVQESGAITVTSNQPTTWEIDGPEPINQTTATANITYPPTAIGNYTIQNIAPISGYTFSVTPSTTQALTTTGVTFTINYAASPPPGPTLTSVSGSTCSRLNLTWTDISGETGYNILRSESGVSGTYVQIGNVSANTTTYNDDPTPDGRTYYYIIQSYSGSGTTNSNAMSGYAVACAANLGNSTKTITAVNGVAYNPGTTTISDGDTVTFTITIVNGGTGGGILNGITDTFTNVVCPCSATLNGVPTTITGSAPNLTLGVNGTIPASTNWLVLLNARASLPVGVSAILQNEALINCVSQSGGADCSKSVVSSYLVSSTSAKTPQFREIPQ